MHSAGPCKKIIAEELLSAALAAGLGLTADTAAASADAWPGCPEDHPSGPCHWCPGNPPVQTGNHVTNPVRWDESVCHTYWYVYFGQGNVAQNIFEGDVRPRLRRRRIPVRSSSTETTVSRYSECSARRHDGGLSDPPL
jgi:hypothetical protein